MRIRMKEEVRMWRRRRRRRDEGDCLNTESRRDGEY